MTSKRTKKPRKNIGGKAIASIDEFEQFPELFTFFYDSIADLNERRRNISPLSIETYQKIYQRLKAGAYPPKFECFAIKELRLSHPKSSSSFQEEVKELLAKFK